MTLLTAAEVSWNRKRKGLFATSRSMEHDEQGILLLVHWSRLINIINYSVRTNWETIVEML